MSGFNSSRGGGNSNRGQNGQNRGGQRSGMNRAGQGRTGANRGDERREGRDDRRQGYRADDSSRRDAKGRERNRKKSHERDFSTSAPRTRAREADAARLVAFEVMQAVATEDSYANLVMPKSMRNHRLDQRDAGFATELTYGTLRNQGYYDAVLTHCVDRPLEKIDQKILTALRLGAHQLLAMRVPSHAALNQTVGLARAVIGAGPATFINAVLRRVSEKTAAEWRELIESEATDDIQKMALTASHPVWVVRAFRQALAAHGRSPQEIEALLDADNAAPIVNLVELPGIGSLDEARDAGAVDGELVEGSALYSSGDLRHLESVREGTVRAQDVGSQLVARALAFAPLEGEDSLWLDLCAGPGGKAALLAAIGAQRQAQLVANESAAHRAKLVSASLRPLRGSVYKVVTGDGRDIAATVSDKKNLPAATEPNPQFDRVMVDVPCSGLGALRRRPEARWRKSPRDIAGLLPLQKELFDAAVTVTRAGGLIAYVTCSPHMAETQNIVNDIVADGAVELLDSASALRAVALSNEQGESVLGGELDPGYAPNNKQPQATTAQLWPHVHGTDAMFFALFRKK
ncbi:RsmB/NOP family class I SAM-dependent RNA methyltransferase [Rothia sp. ZJ1223]|uniref:RsmB/NOP family class I SAM-dependent RNA methyltransferase n=1 Tax=Rothia sp. ZJ1223 TaxID=2811098 RepID=UPI00195BEC5F|nr:transcription antitermination factor NusB [Rothia sp. ZJ1223]MBM7050679.1 16S rRNA methyltransferase [Rothia sp. ZJ1223]